MRTPKDDPDKRPLLERIEGDNRQLAKDLLEWVLPAFDEIEDRDLYARCSLLLGYTAGVLSKEVKRVELTGEVVAATLQVDEGDRQLVLMALAVLSLTHPGWDDALNRIAIRIDNVKDGRGELFDTLRQLRADVTPAAPRSRQGSGGAK